MAGDSDLLDTTEGLEARRLRHWYDRLMMLADGVFAIAITFLAIDITNPPDWDGGWASLIAHLAPQLDAYAMSFLVISIYWLAHRRFMSMILKVDAPVTVLTLVMLGLVVLVPPATRLISAHGQAPMARLVYGALVVSIGWGMGALWGYAALVAGLVSEEVGRRVRWFLLALIVITPPFFLALTIAIPHVRPGEIPLALTALFLIGWRMRLWSVKRLGGKPYVA
ncbi:MAG TPA: TMEM175 family protein [Caulobacteraceae bacterium]|nr:TMEM175 family protein [Caulobacteraceae bacterium]